MLEAEFARADALLLDRHDSGEAEDVLGQEVLSSGVDVPRHSIRDGAPDEFDIESDVPTRLTTSGD